MRADAPNRLGRNLGVLGAADRDVYRHPATNARMLHLGVAHHVSLNATVLREAKGDKGDLAHSPAGAAGAKGGQRRRASTGPAGATGERAHRSQGVPGKTTFLTARSRRGRAHSQCRCGLHSIVFRVPWVSESLAAASRVGPHTYSRRPKCHRRSWPRPL